MLIVVRGSGRPNQFYLYCSCPTSSYLPTKFSAQIIVMYSLSLCLSLSVSLCLSLCLSLSLSLPLPLFLSLPLGLLHKMFSSLYAVELISEPAFWNWKSKGRETFGRGVALQSSKKFFHWLEHAEAESDTDTGS